VCICRLTPVARIVQGLAKISDRPLVARFTAKLSEMPPDWITCGDAHRNADLQPFHCGKDIVDINTLRRL
jgi:hypothetical protein